MLRILPLLLLLALPTAMAKEAETAGKTTRPAASVQKQLDELGYKYEVDEDGDFKLVFDLGESTDKRTQLVYVRTPTYSFGSHEVREVWSPGYKAKGKEFPASVANRLLEATQDSKLGAWAKQGQYAVFVVKVPANASTKQLDDAIDVAMQSGDEMEAELTPGKDQF